MAKSKTIFKVLGGFTVLSTFILVMILVGYLFGVFEGTFFNTDFIKNVEIKMSKEIPIYETTEDISVTHTLNLLNPKGRNNGGWVQYGVIFYYIDNVYIGGQDFGVSIGNVKEDVRTFTSPSFDISDYKGGEYTLKSVYYVSRGDTTCSSGSSASCGIRIEPQANCISGQTFSSVERFSPAVQYFMGSIPCEYKSGLSITGVLFPAGDDWSSKYTYDGYKEEFKTKFIIQAKEEPVIIKTNPGYPSEPIINDTEETVEPLTPNYNNYIIGGLIITAVTFVGLLGFILTKRK